MNTNISAKHIIATLILMALSAVATTKVVNYFHMVADLKEDKATLESSLKQEAETRIKAEHELDSLKAKPLP